MGVRVRLLSAIKLRLESLPKLRWPKAQVVNGLIADGCAVGGGLLVAAGIRDIYRPAAFIFAGLYLLAFSFGMTRRPR